MLNIITNQLKNNTTLETIINNSKRKAKPFKDMIIDSVIIGGIAFASTWTGTLDYSNLLIASKGFLLAFCVQLAYERGIKKVKK